MRWFFFSVNLGGFNLLESCVLKPCVKGGFIESWPAVPQMFGYCALVVLK